MNNKRKMKKKKKDYKRAKKFLQPSDIIAQHIFHLLMLLLVQTNPLHAQWQKKYSTVHNTQYDNK
jgi:hypothetical protein